MNKNFKKLIFEMLTSNVTVVPQRGWFERFLLQVCGSCGPFELGSNNQSINIRLLKILNGWQNATTDNKSIQE